MKLRNRIFAMILALTMVLMYSTSVFANSDENTKAGIKAATVLEPVNGVYTTPDGKFSIEGMSAYSDDNNPGWIGYKFTVSSTDTEFIKVNETVKHGVKGAVPNFKDFGATKTYTYERLIPPDYYGDYQLLTVTLIDPNNEEIITFKDVSLMPAEGTDENNVYYVDMSATKSSYDAPAGTENDRQHPLVDVNTISVSPVKESYAVGDEASVSMKVTDDSDILMVGLNYGTSTINADLLSAPNVKNNIWSWKFGPNGTEGVSNPGVHKLNMITVEDRYGNKAVYYNSSIYTKDTIIPSENPNDKAYLVNLNAADFTVVSDGEEDKTAPVLNIDSLSVDCKYSTLYKKSDIQDASENDEGVTTITIDAPTDKSGIRDDQVVVLMDKGRNNPVEPVSLTKVQGQETGKYKAIVPNIYYGEYKILGVIVRDTCGNERVYISKDYVGAPYPGAIEKDFSDLTYYVGIETDVTSLSASGLSVGAQTQSDTVFASGNGMNDDATLQAVRSNDQEAYAKLHDSNADATEKGFYEIDMTNYADYVDSETEDNKHVKMRLEAKGAADGSAAVIKHLLGNGKVQVETAVVKDGYVFMDVTECSPFLVEVPSSDSNTYKINYHLDGGTNATQNPERFCSITPKTDLADPVKSGWDFGGWYTDPGFNNKIESIDPANMSSIGNVDLYAKWQRDPIGFLYEKDGYSDEEENYHELDTLRIYGYSGTATELVIPARKGDIAVTGFWLDSEECSNPNYENITRITLSENIERIEFDELSGLKEIIVPSGNEVYSSDKGVLYSKDKKTLIFYPVGKDDASFAVPEGVTTIEEKALQNEYLKEITIPASVTVMKDMCVGYTGDYEDSGESEDSEVPVKAEGFIIKGKKGTAAETYATANGFTFVEIKDEFAPSQPADSTVPAAGPDPAEVAAELEFNGTADASVPAAKGVKVKAAKKSFTVKWKKAKKKKLKKFDKVEIQYSQDPQFPRTATNTRIVKKSKTSCKVKKLAKKSVYYVRVRDIKYVGGQKHVSGWSAVKKAKVK